MDRTNSAEYAPGNDNLIQTSLAMESVTSGTTTSTSSYQLVDTGGDFTDVQVGYRVKNDTDNTFAYVTGVDTDTLDINNDIFTSGELYIVYINQAINENHVWVPSQDGPMHINFGLYDMLSYRNHYITYNTMGYKYWLRYYRLTSAFNGSSSTTVPGVIDRKMNNSNSVKFSHSSSYVVDFNPVNNDWGNIDFDTNFNQVYYNSYPHVSTSDYEYGLFYSVVANFFVVDSSGRRSLLINSDGSSAQIYSPSNRRIRNAVYWLPSDNSGDHAQNTNLEIMWIPSLVDDGTLGAYGEQTLLAYPSIFMTQFGGPTRVPPHEAPYAIPDLCWTNIVR